MALDELVALYGRNVKRTVRAAEADGLVERGRIGVDGFTLHTVTLTELGQQVAERDEISGTLHLSALAHRSEQRLADFHERLAQAERRHCERHEQAEWQWPTEARYVRTADGQLVDAMTGVIHA
jgi:DNA-binding MarR family transcriptional regulator